MTAFTPEQENRLREIVRKECDIVLAASVGDTKRLFLCLDWIRNEAATLSPNEPWREFLLRSARESMAIVNEETGVTHALKKMDEGFTNFLRGMRDK